MPHVFYVELVLAVYHILLICATTQAVRHEIVPPQSILPPERENKPLLAR
jgi:hypothetical protein